MTKTVADLMQGPQGYSAAQPEQIVHRLVGEFPERPKPVESREPRLMEITLIMPPADVEIVEGLLVYRKKVIAHDREEAIRKLAIHVR